MKFAVGLFVCLFPQIPVVQAASAPAKSPNVIIILVDDMGYGDLGSYGHPTIKTPNLDQMAQEGMRFTQFYISASVCTPSRAALLTGRLPVRTGMHSTLETKNVLYPNSANGLPLQEVTLAEALKSKNYQTAIIGKWHLGSTAQYLPTNQGFDYYFGIPYSNDMGPGAKNKNPPLPLYKGGKVLEENPEQRHLTKRYTEEAIAYIQKNKDKPFFLYYANNFPHTPLHASDNFKGKSQRGLYGDVVAELDWSVGQVLKTLKDLKIDDNTLVIFTSDNGPWTIREEEGGSAGLLAKGKGSPYEGGFRVPAIAWWPGVIKPKQTNTALVTSMDLFPTILKLANAAAPKDVVLDGVDIFPVLTGAQDKAKDIVYYYTRDKLCAVRKGPWKAFFRTDDLYGKKEEVLEQPLLYNLEHDPSEKFDMSKQKPAVLADLRREYEKQIATVVPVPSLLDKTAKSTSAPGNRD
ncbi:MAG: sulfatase [Rufibacter sp.]